MPRNSLILNHNRGMAAAVPAGNYATLKEAAFCKCKEAMDALVRVSDAKCGGGSSIDFTGLGTGLPLPPAKAATAAAATNVAATNVAAAANATVARGATAAATSRQ